MYKRSLKKRIRVSMNKAMATTMYDSEEAESGDDPDQSGHSTYTDLMHEPIIIVLIGCFILLVFVLAILLMCYMCSKRKRNRQRSRSRCTCNRPQDQFNIGYEFYSHQPPPYTSTGMCHRPEMRRCACHENMPYTVHAGYDPLPMTRLSQSVNGSQCRLTPSQERRSETNISSREFPLLQHATRQMANPVYQDSEVDDTDIDRYPDGPLKDLFKLTERSFSQKVCEKLVVSVARYVDYHGDTLILDNMGIYLKVPEGAVKRGRKQWITLVLNWDLSDNPQMTKEQSLVSPVVYVGPHGMKLEKPCTLVYRHCSFDTRHIRVMRSETDLTDEKSWEALCDKTDQSDVCYLTSDECQLKIDKFTLYTCVQSPIDNQLGKKWLQIAVFACPLRKEINHHQIRVYFLNKTPCALQWAIQNEASFGGKLVCPEKVFLFDGAEHDMLAITKYVSDGWEIVDTDNMEKISFIKIWHGHCPHISVCYKRQPLQQNQVSVIRQGHSRDTNPSVAIELSLNLLTYQNTLEDNGEKIFIQVAEDNVTPVTENEIACRRKHLGNIEINVNNYLHQNESVVASGSSTAEVNLVRGNETNAGADTNAFTADKSNDTLRVNINTVRCHEDFMQLQKQVKPRIVPHKLRQQLSVLLDPPKHIRGNDWRALAERLELDACIPKLETMGNKTEHLMNVIEDRHISLSTLKQMLYDMDRTDCVQTIEGFFGETESETGRRAVESSESGYITNMPQHGNRGNVSSQMSWEDNTTPYNNAVSNTSRNHSHINNNHNTGNHNYNSSSNNNYNNNNRINNDGTNRARAELQRSARTASENSAYSRDDSTNFYLREHAHRDISENGHHTNIRSHTNDLNGRTKSSSEVMLERDQDLSSRRAQFEQNNLSSPARRGRGHTSHTQRKY